MPEHEAPILAQPLGDRERRRQDVLRNIEEHDAEMPRGKRDQDCAGWVSPDADHHQLSVSISLREYCVSTSHPLSVTATLSLKQNPYSGMNSEGTTWKVIPGSSTVGSFGRSDRNRPSAQFGGKPMPIA